MAEIINNLAYLTYHLTNLSKVFVLLIEQEILSDNEIEEINNEPTCLDRNVKLLSLMRKKDWENNKGVFVKILRDTGNGHCANKLEHSTPEEIIAETQIAKLSTIDSVAIGSSKNKITTGDDNAENKQLLIDDVKKNGSADTENIKISVVSTKTSCNPKECSLKTTTITVTLLIALCLLFTLKLKRDIIAGSNDENVEPSNGTPCVFSNAYFVVFTLFVTSLLFTGQNIF